jgi:hypothetical protein
MDDPPDPEPVVDAPHWAFYSLWPRIAEPVARSAEPVERRREVEPSTENRGDAVMR